MEAMSPAVGIKGSPMEAASPAVGMAHDAANALAALLSLEGASLTEFFAKRSCAPLVTTCCRGADKALASALYADGQRRLAALEPMARFSLFLALVRWVEVDARKALGDDEAWRACGDACVQVDARKALGDDEAWRACGDACVHFFAFLTGGADDGEVTALGSLCAARDDAAVFGKTAYCAAVALHWRESLAHAALVDKGEKLASPREGRDYLLGRMDGLSDVESMAFDFAGIVARTGFTVTSARVDGDYLAVKIAQVRVTDVRAHDPMVACVVCCDSLPHSDMARLVPCGHAGCCAACAAKLGECPECRAPIEAVHRDADLHEDIHGGAPVLLDYKAAILHASVLAVEMRRVKDERPDAATRECIRFDLVEGDVTITGRVTVADALTLGRQNVSMVTMQTRLASCESERDRMKVLQELNPLRTVHVQQRVAGKRKCQLKQCDTLESDDHKFLRCARCKDAAYCSKECQRLDWSLVGNHKRMCGTVPVGSGTS
ncbi:hypothetical protein JL721_3092 [Aureococcus anophagefferens]|nr:hypothetical protein JL721_3092 [Aureococcus anophagefferens]